MKIDIKSETVVYITIGDHTYYIDDSTNEQIIQKWENSERKKNIDYLQNDFGLKELWNEDEFLQIPTFTDQELKELVTERKDFYNEQ